MGGGGLPWLGGLDLGLGDFVVWEEWEGSKGRRRGRKGMQERDGGEERRRFVGLGFAL